MALQIQSNFDETKNNWKMDVAGEIDISTAAQFRSELESIYEKKNADISIFLEQLQYIDSTGLGVIIGAYGKMQEDGFSISLKNPGNSIEKLLRITSLDKIFCSAK